MKNQSGIYEILNTVNGKRYIGQAVKFSQRWRGHLKRLRKGAHHSPKLQNAWNKHGESAFEFRIILVCAAEKEILRLYEQRCLDSYKPFYNISPTAGSPLGTKRSPAALVKIRAAAATRVGVPITSAHRQAISKGKTGLKRAPFSDEWISNISASHKGLGKTLATREKISESKRGKKRKLFTAEWCAKLSAVNVGRKHTDAARANMSKAQRGRKCAPRSQEACAKHSRDMKMYWDAVRAGTRERRGWTS